MLPTITMLVSLSLSAQFLGSCRARPRKTSDSSSEETYEVYLQRSEQLPGHRPALSLRCKGPGQACHAGMAAEGLKRPAENGGGEIVAVAKKPRTDDGSKALAPSVSTCRHVNNMHRASPSACSGLLQALPIISLSSEILLRSVNGAVKQGPKRTSNLEAPIMLLSGHGGEVFSCRFNPDGDVLASGSHDKSIHLWRVFEKECPNYMLLKGTVP